MRDFPTVKVACFFEKAVKVEIGKNDNLTFSNSFIDLSQLLPTFPVVVKVAKTTTFQLLPP